MFFLYTALSALFVCACAREVLPPLFFPATAFTVVPTDRWSARNVSSVPGGLVYLNKWGSGTAIAASLVNATAPPHPTQIGLLYATGSSNGYCRVSLNGQIMEDALNTFSPQTNYTNEFLMSLKGLPNNPLWVLSVEATGKWQSGSKDSYIEVVGVNVYY